MQLNAFLYAVEYLKPTDITGSVTLVIYFEVVFSELTSCTALLIHFLEDPRNLSL